MSMFPRLVEMLDSLSIGVFVSDDVNDKTNHVEFVVFARPDDFSPWVRRAKGSIVQPDVDRMLSELSAERLDENPDGVN